MEMMDIKDVAKALGVCTRTVTNLVENGQFPRPARLGRLLKWPKRTVETWLDTINHQCAAQK